jgi:hypothetical protein
MNLSDNEELFKLLKVLGWQVARADKYSPKPDKLPHHIVRLNKNVPSDGGDITFFPLVGKQDETFWNVLNLLLEDPRAKNRSRREKRRIREELLDYCRDIIQDRENIQNNQDIDTRAGTFLNQVLLPEQEWLVVSPIDSLSLERRTGTGITISNQRINWFDLRFITKFTGELDAAYQKILEEQDLQGKVCVFVNVRAIDQKKAIEMGREKIDQILHIIRGYFGTRIFYNLPTPNLYVAINKKPEKAMGASRPIHDEGCNISGDEEDGLSNYMSSFSNFLDGSMPEPISNDLLRAIRWFGSAVQDKELEDKLVKYFFALETLLVPEEIGGKRKRLVHRLGLLQLRFNGGLPDPDFVDDIDHLYQKRSNIVHGGDLEGEPVTKYDIQLLESLTRGVILNIRRVIIDNQGAIRNVKELRDWIELDRRERESDGNDQESRDPI